MSQLITKGFAAQCLAFPDKVDAALAKIETIEDAKGLLDQASAMRHYAERLKAGIEVERPIAIGVLKIKTKLGQLMPSEQGKKPPTPAIGSEFAPATVSAYRKLAANKDKFDEYCESVDDVPTQAGFIKFISGVHVTNNSANNEWYTPSKYIESARVAMGSIDIDPASSKVAQKTVKAEKYFTIKTDGLSKTWCGNVWLNPPYGKDVIELFATKVCKMQFSQAIVLVNNATETGWFQPMAKAASVICFPKGRIRFKNEHGEDANSPLQGQAFLYFGQGINAFTSEFQQYGLCVEVMP